MGETFGQDITITFEFSDKEKAFKAKQALHDALVGNEDYINSNIIICDEVLNSKFEPIEKPDDNKWDFSLYIFENAKKIPLGMIIGNNTANMT